EGLKPLPTHLFHHGSHVGVIDLDEDLQSRVTYDTDPGGNVFLPPASDPTNFLANFLPDPLTIRERWTADRRIRGWSNPPPHILLAEYGEDVAGALSFSHSPELPSRTPVEADIPARIRALERDSRAWYPRD